MVGWEAADFQGRGAPAGQAGFHRRHDQHRNRAEGRRPGIEEDWDHFVLGKTLIDTLVPHARNPAPFSTHELRYFTNQWIAAMSGDDRRALSDFLMCDKGRCDFNRRNR
jgi:hypothetical protein